VEDGLKSAVHIHIDDTLDFVNRICMPQGEVRQKVLAEAYSSPYSIHPEEVKMY